MAVAWNLLAMTGGSGPTNVDLYDAVGLAGGGSGAAAGLLHPYTPRGKLLWRGREGLISALKLISAAELAASVEEPTARPFVWRQAILRPATKQKQAEDFGACRSSTDTNRDATVAASPLTAEEARRLVPGLGGSALLEGTEHAALLIQGGLVLDPFKYCRALWLACRQITKDAGGARVRLIKERVTSLRTLEGEHGPYSAVIVATGAAAGIIEEVGDRLGCELTQGYTLQMVPRTSQTNNMDLGQHSAVTAVPSNGTQPAQQPPQSLSAEFASTDLPSRDSDLTSTSDSCKDATGQASLADSRLDTVARSYAQQGEAISQPSSGEDRNFDSCLQPPQSAAHQSQQRQIRKALELQVSPAASHPIGVIPEVNDPDEVNSVGYDSELEEEAKNANNLEGYLAGAPSLLSSKYLAVQGGRRITLGATKRPGLSPEEAFQECGRRISDESEQQAAAAALMPEAALLWPPVQDWRVRRVRSGVRALPPRTQQGAMPLAGRLQAGCKWWVVGGLGARGLVYHAWLGELVAQAVLNDDETILPKELLRWKS